MPTTFNPPPGWPTPPVGWLPPAGWLPEPSWPAPPPGWQFLIEGPDPASASAGLPVPWIAGDLAASDDDQSRQTITATVVPPTVLQRADLEPEVIWAVKGQPLTGIGAGRYKLTPTMLYFEKGTLSTRAQQVPIAHVVDVDMRQSMSQKARNVGNISVHVQRGHGIELVILEDVPDPQAGVSILNATAYAARLADQQRHNTHHYANVAPNAQHLAATAPASAAPSAVDPIDQLRRLGELRDAGIVTEEEFTAKKVEILSRL